MINLMDQASSTAFVHFAAMMSPGPTALVVIRSCRYGRHSSMAPLVLGIGAATACNALIVMLGYSFVVAAKDGISKLITSFGTSYLVYLGVKNLTEGYRCLYISREHSDCALNNQDSDLTYTKLPLFRDAYLVNFLNPKIIIFYISIFSQCNAHENPNVALSITFVQLVIQSILYWSCFVALSKHHLVEKFLDDFKGWIDIAFGCILCAFAACLFLSMK